MPTTILVEPNPGGHRPQAVAIVAAVASRTSDVLVLTSRGSVDSPAFQEYIAHLDLRVEERFTTALPQTREIAREVAAVCRAEEIDKVVLMDADQALKRWWYLAPLAFGTRRRPRVMFMLTRYPAKLKLTDWAGWKIRLPKALLALIAMASGSLHHVAGFAGRDDMSRGWIVKRARDPEVCSAHARDRTVLRMELGLPADRPLVGIFGGVNERKNAPLIWEGMSRCAVDADLLLAGGLTPGVAAWVDDAVAPSAHGRILVRDAFLDNEVLDKMVAAVDVVPLAMTLNGPSGIQGKALAAGVPVVTAGSEVRARELVATDGGEAAELDADSIGAAITRVLARDPDEPRRNNVPPATPEEFGETILDVRQRG